MFAVTLNPEMEQEMEQLATVTGHSEGFHVKEALVEYLDTRPDYLLALDALKRDEPRTSLADVRRELGLER